MNKNRTVVAVGLLIIVSSFIVYFFYPWELEEDNNTGMCELERDINNEMSIMVLWPHPYD
jgi:hypothetical protein